MRFILIFSIFFFGCAQKALLKSDNDIASRLSIWPDRKTIKPVSFDSPTIQRLINANEIQTKQFWDSISIKGTPMIEVSQDTNCLLLTFLYRNRRSDIQVSFDIKNLDNDSCYGDMQLKQIENSDIWFRTYRIPKDLTFSYCYSVKSKTEINHITDSFNINRIPIGAIKDFSYNSFDYFLDTTKVWFYINKYVKSGSVTEFDLESKILKNNRIVKVYKPYGYNDSIVYPVIVIFDQSLYIDRVPLPTILDNLIAANKILPCVAIMVDNQPKERRNKELPLYKPFADFVALELMPWAHENFKVTKDPDKTIVAGVSYGGLAASFIALNYSNIFGNVLSQSGSYWRGLKHVDENPKWLIQQYKSSSKLPIRFYMDCGLQETFSWNYGNFIGCHREMRDVLKSKGYELYYQEFQSGHDWTGWRKTLPDGLIVLFEKMKK